MFSTARASTCSTQQSANDCTNFPGIIGGASYTSIEAVDALSNLYANFKYGNKYQILLDVLKVLQQRPELYNRVDWLPQLTDILADNHGGMLKLLAAQILKHLLSVASFNDFPRKSLQYLVNFLIRITEKDRCAAEALGILVLILKRHPSVISLHKAEVEKMLVQISVSVDTELQEEVSRAIAALAYCSQGSKKDSWIKMYDKITKSIMAILHSLIQTSQTMPMIEEKNTFTPEYSDNSVAAALQKLKFLMVLLRSLAHLLVSETATINLPLNQVIDVVTKISEIVVKKRDGQLKSAQLVDEIQIAVMMVIEAIIMNCSKYLIPYSQKLMKIFHLFLLPGQNRLLRGNVYKVLNKWICNCACPPGTVRKISQLIFDDITPKGGVWGYDRTICLEALLVLDSIVNYDSDPSFFLDGLLRMVKFVQDNSSDVNCRHPYNDETCRLKLYLLLSSTAVHVTDCASMIHIINIFKAALYDKSPQIISLARKAISTLRICVRPKKNSLLPAHDEEQSQEVDDNIRVVNNFQLITPSPPESPVNAESPESADEGDGEESEKNEEVEASSSMEVTDDHPEPDTSIEEEAIMESGNRTSSVELVNSHKDEESPEAAKELPKSEQSQDKLSEERSNSPRGGPIIHRLSFMKSNSQSSSSPEKSITPPPEQNGYLEEEPVENKPCKRPSEDEVGDEVPSKKVHVSQDNTEETAVEKEAEKGENLESEQNHEVEKTSEQNHEIEKASEQNHEVEKVEDKMSEEKPKEEQPQTQPQDQMLVDLMHRFVPRLKKV